MKRVVMLCSLILAFMLLFSSCGPASPGAVERTDGITTDPNVLVIPYDPQTTEEPETTEPETTEPEITEPETTEPETIEPDPLDSLVFPPEEIIRQIQEAFLQSAGKLPEEERYVRVYRSYGEYDGAYAFMCSVGGWSYPAIPSLTHENETVADFLFDYAAQGDWTNILVWKDGWAYTLREAYIHGWLTEAQMETIHGFYVNRQYISAPEYEKASQVNAPSEEDTARMLRAYVEAFCENEKPVDVEGLYVKAYLGTYDGVSAFRVGGQGIQQNVSGKCEVIAGYVIQPFDSDKGWYTYDDVTIYIEKDGVVYTLKDAFKGGIVSEEQVGILSAVCKDKLYCELPDPNPVNLIYPLEEVVDQIKDAFIAETGISTDKQYIHVFRSYGEYDGALVVQISAMGIEIPGKTMRENHVIPCITSEEESYILGLDFFTFTSAVRYRVWKDGKLCTLQEAYDNGWLTRKQIGQIHSLSYNSGYITYPFFDKDFRVSAPSDDVLSELFQACIKRFPPRFPDSTKIECTYYLGEYDGAYAFWYRTHGHSDFSEAISFYEVAGWVAGSPNCNTSLCILKDGTFYYPHEAFDNGILTEEQIGQIFTIWREKLYYVVPISQNNGK